MEQAMGPDEALRLASWVEGLYTDTTPQQVSFLADQLAPFSVQVAEAEINRFRRQYETLNIANLLRRIADEHQKRTPRHKPADRDKIQEQWKENDALFE